MKHNMKLNKEEFYATQSGLKNIEVRINDKKRKQIKSGDIIEFSNIENNTEKLYVKVKNITKFNNFNDLYSYYPTQRFGKSNHSKKELTETIYKIYNRKEEELGVLAIEIQFYNKEGD